jgi:hypothetical protein
VTPTPPTVTTQPGGTQGCTPGYWKQSQHFDSWVGYATTDSASSVLGRSVGNLTLVQALGANGGGLNALLRATVAALLNASNPNVHYAYTTSQILSMFRSAYDSKNYEPTKNLLDGANNGKGGCPLN